MRQSIVIQISLGVNNITCLEEIEHCTYTIKIHECLQITNLHDKISQNFFSIFYMPQKEKGLSLLQESPSHLSSLLTLGNRDNSKRF